MSKLPNSRLISSIDDAIKTVLDIINIMIWHYDEEMPMFCDSILLYDNVVNCEDYDNVIILKIVLPNNEHILLLIYWEYTYVLIEAYKLIKIDKEVL